MKRNSGFTMLELIIVVAVVGILAAIAVPNFRTMMLNHRLTAGANELFGLMNFARMSAVKEHARVVVTFTDSDSSYVCFIDNGEGGGTAGDGTQNGTERTVKSGKMPKDVTMSDVSFAGGAKRIWFNDRGLPNGGGHVYMTNGTSYRGILVNLVGNSRMVVSKDGVTWN